MKRAACLICLALACLAHHPVQEGMVFYGGSLPPLIIIQEGKPPSGFSVDLLREAMREAGLSLSDQSLVAMNWARAVNEVETSPGHALLVLAKFPDRRDRFKWVGPVAEMPMGVFSRKEDNIRLTDVSDLVKYRLGMVRNTAMVSVLKEAQPGIEKNMVMLRSIDGQLKMLRVGRVDLIVQSVQGTKKTMDGLGMNTDDYPLALLLDPLKLYFGFNLNTSDEYIAILQAALDRLKRPDASGVSRFDRIRAKYFGPELSD